MVQYSKILGTGSFLPEKILTNKDLEKIVETSDEWILERTGIRSRHIIGENETVTSMAAKAALKALEAADLDKSQLDMIIVATTTPDHLFPSTACSLQDELGLSLIPAFDVSAACAGFIYALSIADKFIRTGSAKRVLVIGVEAMSRIMNWQDRKTCVLFGDGAGAVIVGASDEPGLYSTHIHADGRHRKLLYAQNNFAGTLKSESPCVKMEGGEVFKIAVNTLGSIVEETLSANKFTKGDINWLIPHQANLRIIQSMAKKLDMPMERVILTLEKHGNTSAASIPLALDDGIRSGKIKRGETLLMEAFGAGFAWGSALLRY